MFDLTQIKLHKQRTVGYKYGKNSWIQAIEQAWYAGMRAPNIFDTAGQTNILVIRALDRPKALGNSMQENMRRRVLIAKNRLLEPYGACSLLVLAWMHQLETLLFVLHENQWEDTLFQGSPELFSRSVKRRALGSRLAKRTKLRPSNTRTKEMF